MLAGFGSPLGVNGANVEVAGSRLGAFVYSDEVRAFVNGGRDGRRTRHACANDQNIGFARFLNIARGDFGSLTQPIIRAARRIAGLARGGLFVGSALLGRAASQTKRSKRAHCACANEEVAAAHALFHLAHINPP